MDDEEGETIKEENSNSLSCPGSPTSAGIKERVPSWNATVDRDGTSQGDSGNEEEVRDQKPVYAQPSRQSRRNLRSSTNTQKRARIKAEAYIKSHSFH